MANAKYYRRQAELCLHLALAEPNQRTAFWLVELAQEFTAKAHDAENSPSSVLAYMIGRRQSPGGGRDRD
jgi:hypothetical protein